MKRRFHNEHQCLVLFTRSVKFLWQWTDETLSTKEFYIFNDLHKWTSRIFLSAKISWNWNKNNAWSLKRDPTTIAPFWTLTQKERTKITVALMLLPLFYLLIRCPTQLFGLLNNKQFCVLYIPALHLGKHNYKFCFTVCFDAPMFMPCIIHLTQFREHAVVLRHRCTIVTPTSCPTLQTTRRPGTTSVREDTWDRFGRQSRLTFVSKKFRREWIYVLKCSLLSIRLNN